MCWCFGSCLDWVNESQLQPSYNGVFIFLNRVNCGWKKKEPGKLASFWGGGIPSSFPTATNQQIFSFKLPCGADRAIRFFHPKQLEANWRKTTQHGIQSTCNLEIWDASLKVCGPQKRESPMWFWLEFDEETTTILTWGSKPGPLNWDFLDQAKIPRQQPLFSASPLPPAKNPVFLLLQPCGVKWPLLETFV